jgi:putative flippase GtrA
LFKREVIEQIEITEDRFGFEPEVTAKIAALRVRIFEIGISYYGRTYEEGKKIGMKDGFRALYCILRYNGHRAPIFLQLLIYSLIGGLCAIFNLLMFSGMRAAGLTVDVSVAAAFVVAALLNYLLCIVILFRHKARWNTFGEAVIYLGVVAFAGVLDVTVTKGLIWSGFGEVVAKATSSFIGLADNFAGRRLFVFPEPGRGPWQAQVQKKRLSGGIS